MRYRLPPPPKTHRHRWIIDIIFVLSLLACAIAIWTFIFPAQ